MFGRWFAVLVLVAAILTACGDSSTTVQVGQTIQPPSPAATDTTTTTEPSPATTVAPEPTATPTFEPTEPEEFAAALDGLETTGWVAADLLDRVELGDNRYLWIFGDTFRGQTDDDGAMEPGWSLTNSSAVLQTGQRFELVTGYGDGSWMPAPGLGAWMWPQEALVLGDYLYVFAIDLIDAPSDIYWWRFRQVGGTIVVYALEDLSIPETVIHDVPHVRGNPFGWGALLHENQIYVYAHESGSGTYVARFEPHQIAIPETWTFWNGDSWVADVGQAVSVATDRLRVFTYGDRYAAAALPSDDQRLHVFTADLPVGPWTLTSHIPLDAIYPDVPSYAYEPLLIYPLVVATDGAEVVIAVNFLPLTSEDMLTDTSRYGPRFTTTALPSTPDPIDPEMPRAEP